MDTGIMFMHLRASYEALFEKVNSSVCFSLNLSVCLSGDILCHRLLLDLRPLHHSFNHRSSCPDPADAKDLRSRGSVVARQVNVGHHSKEQDGRSSRGGHCQTDCQHSTLQADWRADSETEAPVPLHP